MNETTHPWNPSRETLESRLRQFGIQPTQQRLQIAQVLFAQPQHLSADQLLAKLNLRESQVSKATVYNTLNLFAREGLVREVIVDPTKVFYDPNTHPHHHFYNEDSGELMDIEAQSLTIGDLPTPPAGTRTEGVEVIVRVRNN